MPESAPSNYEELARGALLEITPAATIGSFVGLTPEDDGSVTVRFTSAQPGYPDWLWTVSVADVDGGEPTVLEAELLPGEGALLAPDWVPWSDRLAEYKAAQEAIDAEAAASAEGDDAAADAEGDDDDDDLDDDLDDDDLDEDDEAEDDLDDHVIDDDDVLGSDVLHGGDLDGVDIDDLDEDLDDDDDDDDSDSDLDDEDDSEDQ